MASSSVVGVLRVLLSADTAEYQKDMAKSASAAQTFAKDVKAAGTQAEAVAAAMNKAFTKAEEGTKGLGRAIASLAGFDAIEKANTYAKAVEAIGGVSRLTAAEQSKVNAIVSEASAKYAALGREAPASLTALANATKAVEQPTGRLSGFMGDLSGQVKATALGFISAQAVLGTVQAVMSGTVGEVLSLSGQLSDLSEQTGIGVVELQRLKYAGDLVGISMDQVASAVGQMQKRLASNDDGAVEALAQLGIRFEDIRDQDPGKQFEAIASEISKIKDPAERARVAMEVFGKSGIQLLPLLRQDLKAVGDEAERVGAVMSEKTVSAADKLGDAWSKLKNIAVGMTAQALTPLLNAVQQINDPAEWERAQKWLGALGLDAGEAASQIKDLGVWVDVLLGRVTKLADVKPLANIQQMFAGQSAAALAKGRTPKGDELEEIYRDLADGLDRSKKAFSDAASEAKRLQTIHEQLFGGAAIKSAQDYVTVVGGLVNVSKLTREAQDQVNDTIEKALVIYKTLGTAAPRAMTDLYTATFNLDRFLDRVGPKLTALPSGLQGIGQVIEVGVVPPVQEWQLVMDKLLKDLDKLPPDLLKMTAIAAPTFDTVRVRAERAGAAIADIGRGIQDIGRMIPGVAGLVIDSFGGMVSAVGGLQSAFEQAETSQHKFALNAVASATFVIGAYQQLVSIAEKLTGDLGAGEFFDAINSRGGRSQVQTSGMMAGFNTQILLTTRDAESFRNQLSRFDRAVAASNDRLQKYGLTWRDLGDHIQQANIDQATRDLVADFRALGNAGVDVEKRITAMSGGLSQLVVDAVTTGQQIPVALQPMLETLIRSGKLSEEAARALLGMSGEAVVSFKDVEDAAKRYGIEIDRLGPKIKQLKINDIAAQIIKDWELLQSAGADTNTTLVGMQRSVQDLVTEALKAGVKIPEGMRPIIQAMIDAGLLTDEFGNKLTDISGIEFEKPITAAIEDLISALDRLIDKLSGVGDEAIRTRGELEKIGDAVPRGTTGTGTGTGDTHPNDPKPEPGPARPRPAPQFPGDDGRRFAHGGIVGRVLSFPSPRGADRVPVMASEGEAFLNVPAVQAIGKPAIDALNRGWQMPIPSGPQAAPGPSQAGDVILNLSLAGATFKDANDAAAQGRAFGEAFLKEVHKGGTIRTQFKDEVTSVMRSA